MSGITVDRIAPNSISAVAAATYVVSFSSLPPTGDAVFVCMSSVGNGSMAISTVTDNQTGNTFVKVTSETDSQSELELWWCPSITAPSGTYTVTVTVNSSANYQCADLAMIAVSGLAGTIDKTGIHTSGAVTTATVTASGPNTSANDFVIAAAVMGTFTTSAGLTSPPNTGYTAWLIDQGASNGQTGTGFGYKIVSAIETSSASWSWTASSNNSEIIATFQGAAVAAASGSITRTFKPLRLGTPVSRLRGRYSDTVVVANPNVTVAITGLSASFTAGSLSAASAVAVAGQSATFASGTVAPNSSIGILGQSASFTAGTLIPASSLSLGGQTATFASGTLGLTLSLGLGGQSATFTSGTLTPSASIALAGQSASFTSGTLVPSITIALGSQSATFSAGTLTANIGGNLTVSLSGQTATFSTGTLSPASAIALAGSSASFTPGSIAPNASFGLGAQSATFTPGSVTPAVSFGIVGSTGNFSAGTITAQAGGNVTLSLTGITATFTQGVLGVTGQDQGNQGAGRSRRRLERYIVRIDSQEFVCFSREQALEILRRAQEAAKLFALNEIAKADFPNLELPKLQPPKISVNTRELRSEAAQTKNAITATYRQVLIDAELKMLFEIDQRKKDDDETLLYLM